MFEGGVTTNTPPSFRVKVTLTRYQRSQPLCHVQLVNSNVLHRLTILFSPASEFHATSEILSSPNSLFRKIRAKNDGL
jgi:hypothetical protein